MAMMAPRRVAVIGAGIAGATCARYLADAGYSVQVFDKSRGTGGRMATRRVEWAAQDGIARKSSFDHGAPGFTARSPDFARFAEQARRDGLLSRWMPIVAPGSYAPLDAAALWVPAPDMPALCRELMVGVPVRASCLVDGLRRRPDGWCVESAGVAVAEGFSDLVLAIPPQQAASLLRPHSPDRAQQALALPMLPCWTLMGVTQQAEAAPAWELAWPTQGPLSWLLRNDAKPGRERLPGLAHWVVHATASWSQTHLESAAADVQALLQDALARSLGRSLAWQHAAVHRWRYATVPRAETATPDRFWWDASLGLGMCGDALGGGGVEGAWTSARALASAIIDRSRASPPAYSPPAR